MRLHCGVLPFAIVASRSVQGLPLTSSGVFDRTVITNATLLQNPTSHADRATRDIHMYICPSGPCNSNATSAAQPKGRVPIPLLLAGAGLATVLGTHGLAIPLAIVAFSDSAVAENLASPEIPTSGDLNTINVPPCRFRR